MKSVFKWFFIIGTVFFVIIVAAVLIIPKFVNIQKYKPTIEQKVAEATGRSFTLGDDIDLSVFPWVGVKLTDLHLGNPEGFNEKDMVSVKNFEVRLKVMPLLSKRIEIKTFVLDGPAIYLEKLTNGKANWQGMGGKQGKKAGKKKEKTPSEQGLPIESLMVGNFSITNGSLIYVDQGANVKKQISDLNLNLENISLENPVGISFAAMIDGKPVSLEGTAGPIGKEPGKGTMAIDFAVKVLEELEITLKGNIVDSLTSQAFDLEFTLSSFSPRKLMAALNQKFPVQTKDPKVLDAISLKTRLKGNPASVSLSQGELRLDDSKILFSASAKEFLKPNLKFDLTLDEIDLDRYLPPPPAKEKTPKAEGTMPSKKTDYGPLRKLVLDGKVKVGKLKAHGAIVEKVDVHILAKNGIVTIDPMDLNLYDGSVASKLVLNVQKNTPQTKVTLDAKDIQVGPLMKDALQKELIEGTLKAKLEIAMTGETPDMIKQTLTGQGELLFNDGAIIGYDLAGMVRNIKGKFGVGEQVKEKPRTDFAELKIPFTAKNGLINTVGTSMTSPLVRVIAKGNINLVKELLDLRIEPKFVATLKGQGDSKQRSGLMVPVLITGTFTSPKIRPDLAGMVGGQGLPSAEGLKQALGSKEDQKAKVETVKEDAKKQLKSLLPGFTK
ncbi:MAG: AsmA family protein [Desulfobacula sp.]|jgi:AsmA protein|uniref:AsmA family protein n=1 Tax=Desulfobacula sp. TaxID=2593537 RepID=UPI001DDA6AFD|nr:AsmA family protein [Desulfobacula sp.]MBT3484202.1 AsmA family protein [Desulfobacula sp.]MBT3804324.1 AsmA family protein [Desulfobacula sp.]MBT4026238.1 AsmA family protein [Desulfobacula sp.]MBT4197688.1 AsmA family protein [Desulfobacula sp.]